MLATIDTDEKIALYRVDSFVVPPPARAEFLARIFIIRDFLASQPGCSFNRIAESVTSDGQFRIITIVAWDDEDALENAKKNAALFYDQTGFNPGELLKRLDIVPDFGLYHDIAA
jgi:hypothetical protein